MTQTTASTTRVVGMNDEQTTCDACGRMELRGTVILADENGEFGRYGTTCAGRILGWSISRSQAESAEAYRRQCVASDLRAARAAAINGDAATARMYLRDARRTGIIRPDEHAHAATTESMID